MSELSMIFVLVISLIILIIGLVYLSMSSTQIKSISGYDKDTNLAQAEKYNLWAVVIGWLCVIGLFFAGLGLLFGGEEILLATGGGGLLTGTLVIVVILIIMVGVLSALSASEINKSVQYKTGKQDDKTGAVPAYNDAVIAASSCLGTFLFVVVALIIYQIGKSSASSTVSPLAEEEFRKRNYASRRPVRRAPPPLPPRRQQVRSSPPPLPPRPRTQEREEVRSSPPPLPPRPRTQERSPPLPPPEPVVTKTRKEEQVIRKPRGSTTRRSVPYRRRYSTSA